MGMPFADHNPALTAHAPSPAFPNDPVLAALQQELDADPAIQDWKRTSANGAYGTSGMSPEAQAHLASVQARLPAGYTVNNGIIGSESSFLKQGLPSLLALGGPTLAGIFAGGSAAAGSGAAGSGATGAGVLPSTQIGSGYVPAITGGTGLGAGGLSALSATAPAVTSALPSILKLIAPLAGLVGGKLASDGQANSSVPPQLNDLLSQALARIHYQNPLFQAATQQAFQGLPTYAQHGITPPGGSL